MTAPAKNQLEMWRKDPDLFVRQVFKATPDPWQTEVLRAFPTSQRIAMKASKGPGKSCVLAWLCWNFLLTRLHPKIAVTSITADNLADGLWTEMAKWQGKSPMLLDAFEWTKTRISSKDHWKTWWMSARNWPKTGDINSQADTLAGLHDDYMMFVLDEAGGIPGAVMAAAEAGLAVGIETKLVLAGNPTQLEGPLHDACTKERHLYTVVSINGDPANPNRAHRVDIKWAQSQIDKYGKDNPWVLVNVFGEFPPGSLNALISADDVEKAMRRHVSEESYRWSQKRLGVDIARYGDDSTVIFPRQGLVAKRSVEMKNASEPEVAARIAQAKLDWGSELEFIDNTGGHGSGVVDFMNANGYAIIPVNFSQKPSRAAYYNKRAEMWFEMAAWIKRGGCLPPDSQLARELTTPTYTYTPQGKLRLEAKEQIKERLGFSPDKADALALTFAHAEAPGVHHDGQAIGMPPRQKQNLDWNPLNDDNEAPWDS